MSLIKLLPTTMTLVSAAAAPTSEEYNHDWHKNRFVILERHFLCKTISAIHTYSEAIKVEEGCSARARMLFSGGIFWLFDNHIPSLPLALTMAGWGLSPNCHLVKKWSTLKTPLRINTIWCCNYMTFSPKNIIFSWGFLMPNNCLVVFCKILYVSCVGLYLWAIMTFMFNS